MRRILYLLFMGTVLLSSCRSSSTKQTTETAASTSNIDSLERALSQESDPAVRLSLKRQITDLKMQAVTPEERIRIFEDFLTIAEEDVYGINKRDQDYLDRYNGYRMDEEGNRIEPHDSIKQREQRYAQLGLAVEELGEGAVELVLSDALFSHYVSQLPPYYQTYWHLLKDQENITPDGCLILTWRELGDLIARLEAYPKTFPDHPEIFPRLSDGYQDLQSLYITGTDNTEIMNEKGALLPELKKEWQRFSTTYPESPTTKMIQEAMKHKDYRNLLPLREQVSRIQQTSDHPLLVAARAQTHS
ncbi:hypothetical protein [uncultured Porphyromonas sp.]|uniref:hypothetical protein n=1 Tax=uncultured Porphyromonas sp. TaxID=159274 RepID=UPI00260D4DE9|nr:hypothetical protein [uncultured Porphyromonas sp.]